MQEDRKKSQIIEEEGGIDDGELSLSLERRMPNHPAFKGTARNQKKGRTLTGRDAEDFPLVFAHQTNTHLCARRYRQMYRYMVIDVYTCR